MATLRREVQGEQTGPVEQKQVLWTSAAGIPLSRPHVTAPTEWDNWRWPPDFTELLSGSHMQTLGKYLVSCIMSNTVTVGTEKKRH